MKETKPKWLANHIDLALVSSVTLALWSGLWTDPAPIRFEYTIQRDTYKSQSPNDPVRFQLLCSLLSCVSQTDGCAFSPQQQKSLASAGACLTVDEWLYIPFVHFWVQRRGQSARGCPVCKAPQRWKISCFCLIWFGHSWGSWWRCYLEPLSAEFFRRSLSSLTAHQRSAPKRYPPEHHASLLLSLFESW